MYQKKIETKRHPAVAWYKIVDILHNIFTLTQNNKIEKLKWNWNKRNEVWVDVK